MRFFLLIFAIFFLAVSVASPLEAQENAPATSSPVATSEDVSENAPAQSAAFNPGDMPSLVFTYWEHEAIKDARNSVGRQRAPTDAQLMRDLNSQQKERLKPPPEERDISLGGISYVSSGSWTIWLNGKRVTPKAIPEEIIDLSVYKEYIELKWFDEWSNQVFPIRLRPHQRFNIDTRIFLPG